VREQTDVPLAPLTTLRLGGPARRLIEVHDQLELVQAVRAADRSDEPLLVLAGGSNVVVADDGFAGTVVLVRTRGVSVQRDGSNLVRLVVQAGEVWDELVARCATEGLAGIECLSGIPGSAGATPIQNVGAYGQEVAETVISVTAYDRQYGEVVVLSAADCAFTYRNSVFKGHDRFVVLDVALGLSPEPLSRQIRYPELARRLGLRVGERALLPEVRSAVLGLRRGKGMVLDVGDHDTWSAGSFFTNPVLDADRAAALPEDAPRWPQQGGVKVSAAWLIERAGFGKGYGTGRARISAKHSLALTNRGGADTKELLDLAREIRSGVRCKFGVELVNEPVLVGLEF
jgi:UDP-N-acetylmuramate dehydrogenase